MRRTLGKLFCVVEKGFAKGFLFPGVWRGSTLTFLIGFLFLVVLVVVLFQCPSRFWRLSIFCSVRHLEIHYRPLLENTNVCS